MSTQQSTKPSSKPTVNSENSNGASGELSITEWRLMLSQFARGLENGDVNPVVANAFANLMGKGLNSYKLQLEYARALGKTPSIESLMPGVTDSD